VEKLFYVIWRPAGLEMGALRAELLGPTAERLRAAGAQRLKCLLADEWTEPLGRARIARSRPPIAGAVSFWLDCVDRRRPLEAALASCTSRLAGYLVTESVPIANTTRRAPPGSRTPGTTMLTLLERPARLDPDAWLGFWNELHTPLAVEIQCTYLYLRHVVVRRLQLDAPPWAGIVEEGFPTEAVTDPMLWYRAQGSAERLRENLGRMLASVRSFLDVERLESLPMSEYVVSE
jgi:hypothetical protein